MRRIGAWDKALLGLLLPVWAVCFVLHVQTVLRPALFSPVGVRASEDGGYPILVSIKPDVASGESDLQRGDRLIQVGAADLLGAGALSFYAHYDTEAEYGRRLRVVYERDGRRDETLMPIPVLAARWPTAFVSLGFALTAIALFWWAPASPAGKPVAWAFLFCAIGAAAPITGSVTLDYAGLAQIAIAWSLAFPLCLRAVLMFPEGKLPGARWARIAPWSALPMGALGVSFFAGVPVQKELGITLLLLAIIAFFVALIIVAVRAYRVADAVGRRQYRWCVLGVAAALTPPATVMALALCDRFLVGGSLRFYSWISPSTAFAILMPVSVLFAVVRYNLFDVDRILSATATYNLVLVALVGTGVGLVPRMAETSAGTLGVDTDTAQLVFFLMLAVAMIPAHQRLRPQIDRIFFRERYVLDEGMAELVRTLFACVDARTLTEQLGAGLDRLLRPAACVVYARSGGAFTPAFVQGRAIPPAFDAQGPLVATLVNAQRPLALSAAGRRPDAPALGPFDRAALEALEAEVVAPMRRGPTLEAFLCLGPKRSGDVYTPSDLAHVASVAESVSSQLRHFDQEDVLREERALQESLRGYVPGAVVDQLATGAQPDSGECEISVLFVDVRGYTSFAEVRTPRDIFSTLNRYTQAVSRIVRDHGGNVVEFNGDGMMAVFGAPKVLARKEFAAVQAGRAMVAAVGKLLDAVGVEGTPPLSVGVGIATGRAFVGSIQAVDRKIWSAVGNTTNLAARLQGLTRELGASMAIDGATHAAMGPAGGDLELRPGILIRGRRDVQDVHVLPLDGPSPAPLRSC